MNNEKSIFTDGRDVKNFSVPSTPPPTPAFININPIKESENLFSQVIVNPSNMSERYDVVQNIVTNNIKELKINLEANDAIVKEKKELSDTKKLSREESPNKIVSTR